jgi:mono/diheme cytochrome c family protein
MKKLICGIGLVCLVVSLSLPSSCTTIDQWGRKPPEKTAELLNRGKKLYEENCIQCHGPNGDGKGWKAAELKKKPRDFTVPLNEWSYSHGDPQKIFEVLKTGIPDTPMAMFDFSDEQRWALVYRVMEFSKGEGQ